MAVAGARALLDGAAGSALRPGGFRPAQLLLVPVKDVLLGFAWLEGFFRRTVDWRGTRLRVLPGTRLAPPAPTPIDSPRPPCPRSRRQSLPSTSTG